MGYWEGIGCVYKDLDFPKSERWNEPSIWAIWFSSPPKTSFKVPPTYSESLPPCLEPWGLCTVLPFGAGRKGKLPSQSMPGGPNDSWIFLNSSMPQSYLEKNLRSSPQIPLQPPVVFSISGITHRHTAKKSWKESVRSFPLQYFILGKGREYIWVKANYR